MKHLIQENKYDEITIDGLLNVLTALQAEGSHVSLKSFSIHIETADGGQRSYVGGEQLTALNDIKAVARGFVSTVGTDISNIEQSVEHFDPFNHQSNQ